MTESIISSFQSESQSVKKCSKCGVEKDVSEFSKNKRTKDGFQIWCKTCYKYYCQVNEERFRGKRKQYNEKHKDRIRKYKTEHYDKEAKRKYNKQYYQDHAQKFRESAKRYRREKQDPLAAKQYRKEYWKTNKIILAEKKKKYREANKELLAEQKKLYVKKPGVKERINKWHRDRLKSDPQFRLNSNIHKSIAKALKGLKAGRRWETLVGYALQDLKKHLEKQFTEGMSWDNYGEWHVDHKVPVTAFNFKTSDDIDFKKCWTLSNLQPLWAHDNFVKNNSIDKPFQPSFAFGGTV